MSKLGISHSLEGFKGGRYVFRGVRLIYGDETALTDPLVYVAERYDLQGSQGEPPLFDVVIIKISLKDPNRLRYEYEELKKSLQPPHGYLFPGLGPVSLITVPLENREMQALVTQIQPRRNQWLPPVLSKLLSHRGVCTEKELVQVIELAQCLQEQIWHFHIGGRIHGDIKPDNIVLQSERGHWLGAWLIDLGLVRKNTPEQGGTYPPGVRGFQPRAVLDLQGEYYPAQLDLYAFGITLLCILLGGSVSFAKGESFGEEGTSEASRDRLLQEAAKEAQEVNQRAEGVWILRAEAVRICLTHLIDPPFCNDYHDSFRRLAAFLQDLRRLRVKLNQVGSLERGYQNRRTNRQSARSVAQILQSLASMGFSSKIIAAYRSDPPEELCGNELYEKGYGRAALQRLQKDLISPGRDISTDELCRSLMNYVILQIREGCYEKALQVIEPYRSHMDPEVALWAEIFCGRLALHQDHGADVAWEHLNELAATSGLVGAKKERAETWILTIRIHQELWRAEAELDQALGKGSRWVDDKLLDQMRKQVEVAASSPEICYGGLLLGRAYAYRRHWDLCGPILLIAAGRALVSGLPHEFAATLLYAARAVERAFKGWNERDGARKTIGYVLYERGADPLVCLDLAAQLALQAADIYGDLDAPKQRSAALRLAARCLVACSMHETYVDALVLLKASMNETLLHLPKEEHGALVNDEFQNEIVRKWRILARSLLNLPPLDPGASLEYQFFGLYSPLIEKLFDGLTIDPIVNGVRKSGGALQMLCNLACLPKDAGPSRRVLVLGCRKGGDAIWLAKRRFQVTAVDSWHHWVAETRRRAEAEGISEITYMQADFANLTKDLPASFKEQYDLVVCHESLLHTTHRASILLSLFWLLKKGGQLLLSDMVQLKKCSIPEYQELMAILHTTGLDTAQGYSAIAERCGFSEVRVETGEATEILKEYFNFGLSRVALLQGEPRIIHRSKNDVQTLRAQVERGVLGWMLLAARKPV